MRFTSLRGIHRVQCGRRPGRFRAASLSNRIFLAMLAILTTAEWHRSARVWAQEPFPPARNGIWDSPVPDTITRRVDAPTSGPGVQPQAPVREYYPESADTHRPQPTARNEGEPPRPSVGSAVPANAHKESPAISDSAAQRTSANPPVAKQESLNSRSAESAESARTPGVVAPSLKRPGARGESAEGAASRKIGSTGSQVGFTVLALAGVLMLILLLSRLLRKHMPMAAPNLSPEVLELLGRRMIDQRHAIHYLRVGERILIVGASLDGLRTLAEITDPVEVDRISGVCRTRSEAGVAHSFRMLLNRQGNGGERVNLDQRHRQRQQQRRQPTETPRHTPFSWTTPDSTEDSGITPSDIADLTRTLEAARERHA